MVLHIATGILAALLLSADPFSLLTPAIRLTPADRRALDEGKSVARTLDGPNDQVGIFAISPVAAPGSTLIERARAIEDLKRSSFVSSIGRFSDPPRLEDLDALQLSPRDVDVAAACKPGRCSFKFTDDEIALLHTAAAAEQGDRAARYQRGFRRVVLGRVTSYLAGGLSALPPVVNRGRPICLDRIFNEVLAASPPLASAPCAAEWLRDGTAAVEGVESFVYWSQETYGAGKPVVVVTHVGLVAPRQPGQPAVVIGKQIFASRYMTGGLALTAVVTDAANGRNYLIYVNRSGVDLLGGVFGPIKRAVLESRLKREVPEIVGKLRTRLERSDAAHPKR
jgi:hypothetical protein